MRKISFAMTTNQIIAQTKTVTRRNGWAMLNPGDKLQPVVKVMGLKKGEKIQLLGCPIEVVSTRWEPLNAITQEDVILEGFPDWSPDQFVEMLVKHYRIEPSTPFNRIEFKYEQRIQ